MSINTTADEKLREATEHINQAIDALYVVLDRNTWGHDEFEDEYIDKLWKLFRKLTKLKEKI